MAFNARECEDENLINLGHINDMYGINTCIDSGYTSLNRYSDSVYTSHMGQEQGNFSMYGKPFVYSSSDNAGQCRNKQLQSNMNSNLSAFENTQTPRHIASSCNNKTATLLPLILSGDNSNRLLDGNFITSTPRDIKQDPFDIGNYSTNRNSDLHRVRFSNENTINTVPFTAPTCQTTFSNNYLGQYTGLGGQTESLLSEPRDSMHIHGARTQSGFNIQPRSTPAVFNFSQPNLHYGSQAGPTLQHRDIPPTQTCTYPQDNGAQLHNRSYNPTPASNNYRQSHYYRREKEPDKFDGKSVELRDYLVHFEQVASWNNWGYYEKGLQLSMSLKGQAQKLLTDMHPDQVKDFNSLKQALQSRFSPAEKGFAYRCEFRSRMRMKNETPPEFGYALKRLADLAFPDIHYTGREQYTIDQFIHGLGNRELRKHVQLRHPTSLAAAISYAVEYEAVDQQINIENKPTHVRFNLNQESGCKSVLPESDIAAKDKQLSDLLKNLNTLLTKLSVSPDSRSRSRSPSPKTKSKVECYQCHGFGHYAADCLSKRIPKRSPSPSPNRKPNFYRNNQEN